MEIRKRWTLSSQSDSTFLDAAGLEDRKFDSLEGRPLDSLDIWEARTVGEAAEFA